jgi:predicted permease
MTDGQQAPRSHRSREQPPGRQAAQLFDRIRQDLAYAARGLARNPGFAATALLTLALGVGASSAMFSVVNTVLLRPLPYPDSDRLVAISTVAHRGGGQLAPTGFADIESWRQSARTLAGIAAYDGTSVVLEDRDQPAQRVTAVNQTANMFDVLGVAPALGRTFTADEAAQREAVAVASHEFAEPHFGTAEAALGANLIINGRPFRIIGVMPPGFRSHDSGAHLFVPETLLPGWDQTRLNRGPAEWRVIARLAPGATLDDARAELAGIAAMLAREFPATNAESGVVVTPLALQVTGTQLRLALFTLVGAVGAVLLIACSNVAGLLLARGAVRQREFAVRTALGASRRRIVGQLVLESVVLAVFAAVVGMGIAAVALKGIRTLGPANIPRLDEISLDGAALAFAVCLSFASAVASSLAPALRSTARDPMSMLRSGRGLSDTPAARRVRSALVSAVFALAVVLLTATALLGRSLSRLTAVDTGFDAERVLVVGMNFPRHKPEEQIVPFMDRLVERALTLPGVRMAAVSEEVLLGEPNVQPLTAEGAASQAVQSVQLPLRVDAITPDFFRTVGVPLRAGRFFDANDRANTLPVVIINEALARKLWPDSDAVGRRLREGGPDSDSPWLTVVGVVADMRRQGADRAPIAQAFRPHTQRVTTAMNLLVAADVDPTTLAGALRAMIPEVDRSVPFKIGTTLSEALDRRLDSRRFILGLIGAFAVIALVLAGVGIFGLINYSVARRTQEIGVRMALGAQPGSVLRMVLGDGLKLALAGIAGGAVLGAMLLPVLASMLFEVSLTDPVSLCVSIGALVGIALLACYLPARRAVAVNPVTALRAE